MSESGEQSESTQKVKKPTKSEILKQKRDKIDNLESEVNSLMDEWRKEKDSLDSMMKVDEKPKQFIITTPFFGASNKKKDEKKPVEKPVKKVVPPKPVVKPVKKDIQTLQAENDRLKMIIKTFLWGDIIIGIIIVSALLVGG